MLRDLLLTSPGERPSPPLGSRLLQTLSRLHGGRTPLWSVPIPDGCGVPVAAEDEPPQQSSTAPPSGPALEDEQAVEEAEELLLFTHLDVSLASLEVLHWEQRASGGIERGGGAGLNPGQVGPSQGGRQSPLPRGLLHQQQTAQQVQLGEPVDVSASASAATLLHLLPARLSLQLGLSSNRMASCDTVLPHMRADAAVSVSASGPLMASQLVELAETIRSALKAVPGAKPNNAAAEGLNHHGQQAEVGGLASRESHTPVTSSNGVFGEGGADAQQQGASSSEATSQADVISHPDKCPGLAVSVSAASLASCSSAGQQDKRDAAAGGVAQGQAVPGHLKGSVSLAAFGVSYVHDLPLPPEPTITEATHTRGGRRPQPPSPSPLPQKLPAVLALTFRGASASFVIKGPTEIDVWALIHGLELSVAASSLALAAGSTLPLPLQSVSLRSLESAFSSGQQGWEVAARLCGARVLGFQEDPGCFILPNRAEESSSSSETRCDGYDPPLIAASYRCHRVQVGLDAVHQNHDSRRHFPASPLRAAAAAAAGAPGQSLSPGNPGWVPSPGSTAGAAATTVAELQLVVNGLALGTGAITSFLPPPALSGPEPPAIPAGTAQAGPTEGHHFVLGIKAQLRDCAVVALERPQVSCACTLP